MASELETRIIYLFLTMTKFYEKSLLVFYNSKKFRQERLKTNNVSLRVNKVLSLQQALSGRGHVSEIYVHVLRRLSAFH